MPVERLSALRDKAARTWPTVTSANGDQPDPRDLHGSGHTEHATACAAVRWPTLRPAEMLTLPSPAHQRVDELRTVRPVPRDDALNWDDPRYPCHVARPHTPKGASRALT
jgi:hypothetical protein